VAAPRFGPIAFASLLTTDFKPVNPSTRFPAGTAKTYAVLQVSGLKESDIYLGAWYRNNAELPFTELARIAAGPSDVLWSAFQFTDGSTPGAAPGSYRLDVSINGKVAQSGTFEVLPPAPVRFGSIVFAHGESSDGLLIDPTVQFASGTSTILVAFEIEGFEGLKAEDAVSDVVYFGADKVFEEKKTAAKYGAPRKGPISGVVKWSLVYSTGAVPAGSYRVEETLNGKVMQTGAFEVH
jgi:hypothetical protein